MSDNLLYVENVAELFGVSERTVWRWTKIRGGIPTVRIGNVVRFRRSSVDAFIARREKSR